MTGQHGPTVRVDDVVKRFGELQAVGNLSFEARPGEVLGFLGPNGSGKTTTMRMILDLLRPDAGRIHVFGEPPSYRHGPRTGYLPEERGLYRDIPIVESVAYLGSLHGLPPGQARLRAERLLAEVGLGDALHRTASALSRGMHQKAQVVATILHEPDLLILDEPFGGLDPLNAGMLRDLVLRQRDRGAAVVLSTHRMEEAEALCDRIVLIHAGRRLLEGRLADIKRSFAGRTVAARGIDLPGSRALPAGVAVTRRDGAEVRYALGDGVTPADLFRILAATSARVERFEVLSPSLEEIFLRTVEGAAGGRGLAA